MTERVKRIMAAATIEWELKAKRTQEKMALKESMALKEGGFANVGDRTASVRIQETA